MPDISLSRLVILAARVLLLGFAASALILGFVAGTRDPRGLDPGGSYTCPMHPEVDSSNPGDCPICRMALERRKTQPPPSLSNSAGHLAAATFVLPQGAEIKKFEELAWGKMFEMSRELRGPAWAETRELGRALLYRDEIALLEPREQAVFFPSIPLRDGSPHGVRVMRVDESATPWDDATSLLRFRVQGKAELLPGQTGSLKFPTRVRKLLAVRSGAIIQGPTGPYVLLVAPDNRTLTKRSVEVGSVLADHAGLLSGLGVGERVAALNTFFLDAERRFVRGAAQ